MPIPFKLARLLRGLRRGPKQLPLDFGPGFIHVNGGAGRRFMLPHQPLGPRFRQAYREARPYLRRWAIPGAVLGGGSVYASRTLDAKGQIRIDGVRAYGQADAIEQAVPGAVRAGAKARLGIRSRGFHTGVYARAAGRSNGDVTEAGKAGVFMRSKPASAYFWIGGRSIRTKKGSPHPKTHFSVVR